MDHFAGARQLATLPPMKLQFTKMHGLGNDFVVVDGIRQSVEFTPEQIRFLADRHRGVGCDQLLLVERPRNPRVDFRYRIFNADGHEVYQCGNGARCFARFVRDRGLTDKDRIRVETAAGTMELGIEPDGQVTVEMGVPRLDPAEVPFLARERAVLYPVNVGGMGLKVAVLSMGNPHAVLTVSSVDTAPVEKLGPLLESHGRFPERVNVGFMEVVERHLIRLRVFERGVGETLACGSGACAAVVAGRLQGLLDASVRVELRGGSLLVHWEHDTDPVFMTGAATRVFEGGIEL